MYECACLTSSDVSSILAMTLKGVVADCGVHACSGPLPSNVSGTAANNTNFFPALRAMNISHNAFSGTLPASFGQSGVFNLKPLQVSSYLRLTQKQWICLEHLASFPMPALCIQVLSPFRGCSVITHVDQISQDTAMLVLCMPS